MTMENLENKIKLDSVERQMLNEVKESNSLGKGYTQRFMGDATMYNALLNLSRLGIIWEINDRRYSIKKRGYWCA